MKIYFITSVTRKLTGKTLLEEPLGGTHVAMFNLINELASRGHEVKIFCNCSDEEGFYENVEYLLTNKIISYCKQNEPNILICTASESVLKVKIKAKKTILWLHNDYSPYWDNELPDIASKISGYMSIRADKLVTVSDWQKTIIKDTFKIPDEHIITIGNGIDSKLFDNSVKKIKNRLIYTSAPDRGLDLLLDFFPDIKTIFPDTELHIYSSFATWGKSDFFHKEIEKKIFDKTKQAGVFLHKPVTNKELAQKLSESYLFLYPNHEAKETYFYAETFGMSVVEAQFAGLPIITSDRGALCETVKNNETGFLINEEPYFEEYKKAFLEKTISLLTNEKELKKYSDHAIDFSKLFDIKNIADQWEFLFNQILNDNTTKPTEAPLKSKYTEPEVSIIMPSYNRASNLVHVLGALTNQTFENFELILIDDGSTDNTKKLVNEFRQKLNIRYVYAGKNEGFRAARARNIGLSRARGNLIVFLDSDIVTPSTYLEEHLKVHAKYDRILVDSFVYRMKHYDETDLGLEPEEYIKKHQDILNDDIKYEFNVFDRGYPIEEGYFLDSNSLSIKRKHIIEEGFDANFVGWGHEDTELGYRFSSKNFGFIFIKEHCESYHIYHPISPQKDEETKVNWKRLTKKYDLKKCYDPLPKITVEGLVRINNIKAENRFLTDVFEGKFEIKVGDKIDSHFPLINFDF